MAANYYGSPIQSATEDSDDDNSHGDSLAEAKVCVLESLFFSNRFKLYINLEQHFFLLGYWAKPSRPGTLLSCQEQRNGNYCFKNGCSSMFACISYFYVLTVSESPILSCLFLLHSVQRVYAMGFVETDLESGLGAHAGIQIYHVESSAFVAKRARV